MIKSPSFSVVMSIYNGAMQLEGTIKSILEQSFSNFELIIVDDGSTDGTAEILEEFRDQDSRIKLISRANAGLTQSLILACEVARSGVIARHDVGDRSHCDRFKTQYQFLSEYPEYNAVTCHTRFFTPKQELMYNVEIDETALNKALTCSQPNDLLGPSHHGSVMFRKSDYLQCGGYRKELYFAQDLDLWTRLVELGKFGVIQQYYYDAVFHPYSISGNNADAQNELKSLIAEMIIRRQNNSSEQDLLQSASKIAHTRKTNTSNAGAFYFMGSCLLKTQPRASRAYFVKCLTEQPFHLKAILKLIRSWF